MADATKIPEEWLKYISHQRKSYDGPDKYKFWLRVYRKAVESIPVNQFGHNNAAYAKILVDFAKLQALTSGEEARCIFQAARNNVKHCSLVYVAWAQFELLHNNPGKCKKLLLKGKQLYAEPKYLLDTALENFTNGNTQLIDEETEEHTFTELINKNKMKLTENDCSKTERSSDSSVDDSPKKKEQKTADLSKPNNSNVEPKTNDLNSVAVNNSLNSSRMEKTDRRDITQEPAGNYGKPLLPINIRKPSRSSTSSDSSDDSYSLLPRNRNVVTQGNPTKNLTTPQDVKATPQATILSTNTKLFEKKPYRPLQPMALFGLPRRVSDEPQKPESPAEKEQKQFSDEKTVSEMSQDGVNVFIPSSDHKRQLLNCENKENYFVPFRKESKQNECDTGSSYFSHRKTVGTEDQQSIPLLPSSVRPGTQPSHQLSAQPSHHLSAQPSALSVQHVPSTMQPKIQPTQASLEPSTPSLQYFTPRQHLTQPYTQPPPQTSTHPSTPCAEPHSIQGQKQNLTQPSLQQPFTPCLQSTTQPYLQHSTLPSTQPSLQTPQQPSLQPFTPCLQSTTRPYLQDSSHASTQPSLQTPQQPSLQPFTPCLQSTTRPYLQDSTHASTQPSLQTPQSSAQHSVQPSLQQPQQQRISTHTKPAQARQLISGPFTKAADGCLVVSGKLYNKLHLIGKGGSSRVYTVFDGHETYAIKYVNIEDADPSVVQSYINEITLLKRLQGHENIIKLYDWEMDEEEKVIKMVLEIGSIDLAGYLRANPGKITTDFIKVCWKQILDAVQVVHDEGIVHSDLKPANFLLVKGNLKLIDFGIANAIQGDSTSFFRDTQIGTLNYMSPEALRDISQSSGGEHRQPMMKIGRASDVWALGCILYLMVYGRTPFQHIPNHIQKWQCIMDPNYEIKFPQIENKDLVDTMKGCLKRNPRERYTIPQLKNHPFFTGKNTGKVAVHDLEDLVNRIIQLREVHTPKTLRTITQNMLKQFSSGGPLDITH